MAAPRSGRKPRPPPTCGRGGGLPVLHEQLPQPPAVAVRRCLGGEAAPGGILSGEAPGARGQYKQYVLGAQLPVEQPRPVQCLDCLGDLRRGEGGGR